MTDSSEPQKEAPSPPGAVGTFCVRTGSIWLRVEACEDFSRFEDVFMASVHCRSKALEGRGRDEIWHPGW